MKTRRFENVDMNVIKEWFAENDYDPAEIEIGYKGYIPEGYQDPDFIDITANEDGTYNMDIC